MSKIFVAGKGLIGCAVRDELLNKNYEVINKGNELDLRDFNKTYEFFKKEQINFVFLCAGNNGGILYNIENPATLFYDNLTIVNNIFKLSSIFDFKVIWYASSCIYPKNAPQPIKEEYLCEGKIEESSIGYSAAKLAGVYGAIAYNKQYSKRILTLIPNTVYGKEDKFDENSHVLSAILKKIYDAKKNNTDVTLWGDGEVYREFVYNIDVARASVFAFESFENIKEDFLNVGGDEIKIKDLAILIAKLLNFRGKIIWDTTKPKGVKRKLLDSLKLKNYGFKNIISLEYGIREVIKNIQ